MITNQNNLASMIAQYRAQQPAQQAPQPVAQPQPQQPQPAQRQPMALSMLYRLMQERGYQGGNPFQNVGMRPNWF